MALRRRFGPRRGLLLVLGGCLLLRLRRGLTLHRRLLRLWRGLRLPNRRVLPLGRGLGPGRGRLLALHRRLLGRGLLTRRGGFLTLRGRLGPRGGLLRTWRFGPALPFAVMRRPTGLALLILALPGLGDDQRLRARRERRDRQPGQQSRHHRSRQQNVACLAHNDL